MYTDEQVSHENARYILVEPCDYIAIVLVIIYIITLVLTQLKLLLVCFQYIDNAASAKSERLVRHPFGW